MSRPRSTVVRSTMARMPRAWRSAILRSAPARMPGRSKRCGQFSCTPGERVTMCSCISVGPSAVVSTGPSAVSTVDMVDDLLDSGCTAQRPPISPGRAVHVDSAILGRRAHARLDHHAIHGEDDAPAGLVDEEPAAERPPAEPLVERQEMLAADEEREGRAVIVVERGGSARETGGGVAAPLG